MKSEWKFPCYGKTEEGYVVYFSSYGNGKMIEPREMKYNVFWDMSNFTPFTPEVEELNESNQNY